MAYNDDAVLARLSALNESHDSIATAAQWIMFHRRHADRTVAIWMQRLKDSSATRRLSLVYLANEVAQQSRIRHKEDFIIAFSPVIAEATSLAYKGAPTEIHAKLRRVVDVWKDRSIFEPPIQGAIEARLDELDKARGAPRSGFVSSPFSTSSSAPPEFASLISAHKSVQKLNPPLKSTISSADQEYEKQIDSSNTVPSAPVYAARLNGLLKTLANAESAVAECVKARQDLITGLEKLLHEQKSAQEADEASMSKLSTRKDEIEQKKQEVELAIMRALGPAERNGSPTDGDEVNSPQEPDRPEMEALTPPALEVEPLTPVEVASDQGDEVAGENASMEPERNVEAEGQQGTSSHTLPISTNGSKKRRRVDDGDDFPDLGVDDAIDADVADMLMDKLQD